MFDKAKLEALRAKYVGAKETEVAPAEFKKALSLVFGQDYRRAMPYAGLSSLLDMLYRSKTPDLPDFDGLDTTLTNIPTNLNITNQTNTHLKPRTTRKTKHINP